MRIDLRYRSFALCAPAVLCAVALIPMGVQAAEEQQPAAGPPAAQGPALPSQPPAAQEPPADQPPVPARPQRPVAQPRGKKPDVPDYPDPRTLTLGAYYFGTAPGEGPDFRSGKTATDKGEINGLGKERNGYGLFASIPVSRTSEIRFEGFRTHGNGNQTLGQDTVAFSTQFYKNDYLSNSYRLVSGKLWVDDLFWPHKFPVNRFRVKAIYGVRYLQVKAGVDAPLQLASGATVAGAFGNGSKQLVLPVLGLAPEFALSKHVLFRVEGSGFGLPHKSYVWDGDATISYRRGKWEIFGGGKAVGFKTSPKKDFYFDGQVYGGVAGIKYHWQ